MSINYYNVKHASIEDIYVAECDIGQENRYASVFRTEVNRGKFIVNSIMYMLSQNNPISVGNYIIATPQLYMGWGQGADNNSVHSLWYPSFSNNTVGYCNGLSSYDLVNTYGTTAVPSNTLVEVRNVYSSGVTPSPTPGYLYVKIIVKGFYMYG